MKKHRIDSIVKEANAACPIYNYWGSCNRFSVEGGYVCIYFTVKDSSYYQGIKNAEHLRHLTLAEADEKGLYKEISDVGYGVKLVYAHSGASTEQVVSPEKLSSAFSMSKEERQKLLLQAQIESAKEELNSTSLPDGVGAWSIEIVGDYVVVIADLAIPLDAPKYEIDALFEELHANREQMTSDVFTDDVVAELSTYVMCGKGICYRYRNPHDHNQFVDVPMSCSALKNRLNQLQK
jgi:hypothetical protein